MKLRIGDLPAKRQILLYAAIVAIYGAGIFWFAFSLVTLRKAFEFTDPWAAIQAFGIASAILFVPLAALTLLGRR